MAKTLKFILRSQIKSSKIIQKPGGFTLIELLVALLIAFLILTPLLGFMVSVLSTDRQEQAKANSEQEIQTALNYISRDVQQAVYIYDADGIEAIKSELRYPSDTTKSPVLVFWKRELESDVIPAADGTTDDTFVYSLVAYYLIKENSNTWSNAARIARWQIKDGVRAANGTYITPPSAGFAPFTEYFDEADSLKIGMEKWKKSGTYDTSATVLIDYVDQSTEDPRPAANCPTPATTWSTITPANNRTGFYVCVDSFNTTAQVFIRGNALARIENDGNRIKYNANNQTYFPTTSVRVEGRGFLFR
ncbi:hormogonium polysaccharide secretion pseudopilin HpsC [Anabaena sp. CCY 0017]|uniref:hormogonium polysaccharide secretion pseudopilin HpsC n=1 Tax=Anabaena sp. CCY 0017 TaxID=3103866 RepID=UPI0039C63327